jgi:hypothetical protein
VFGLRRVAFSLIALVVLANASSSGFASQSIEDLARDKQAEIVAAGAETVPREKIEALWNKIKQLWDLTYLPLRVREYGSDPSEMLRIRLNGIVYDLIERGAFKVLTPEIKNKLQLSDLTCKYEGHCTSLDGLYLPLNNIIFLDTSLGKVDLERVFLHELIHAYQFTYRLPIDIATLNTLAQHGKVKSEEVNLYLDYYYEAQANWKGMQYSLPHAWLPEVEKGDTDHRLRKGFFSNLALMFGPVFVIPSGPLAIVVGGASVILVPLYDNVVTDRLLPNVAQSGKFLTFEKKYAPADNFDAVLMLPELIPISDSLSKAAAFHVYNFNFHKEYGDAIQKYYFGSNGLLFRNDRDDLKIYNELHNEYYKRIGLNYMLESDSACRALLIKLRESTYSPLVTWLTLPKAEMEACPAYRGLGDNDGRAEYLDQLLNPQNGKDPFHSGLPGTEGSRPGLTILPQLRVLPIEKKQK